MKRGTFPKLEVSRPSRRLTPTALHRAKTLMTSLHSSFKKILTDSPVQNADSCIGRVFDAWNRPSAICSMQKSTPLNDRASIYCVADAVFETGWRIRD
jgi:hypothetical protein